MKLSLVKNEFLAGKPTRPIANHWVRSKITESICLVYGTEFKDDEHALSHLATHMREHWQTGAFGTGNGPPPHQTKELGDERGVGPARELRGNRAMVLAGERRSIWGMGLVWKLRSNKGMVLTGVRRSIWEIGLVWQLSSNRVKVPTGERKSIWEIGLVWKLRSNRGMVLTGERKSGRLALYGN